MLEEQAMITFLKKFDEHPFLVKINGHEHLIGEGAPTFTVNFKKVIPLKDLVTSTSLALGEAYMDGDLDIEGNLYQALDNLLGQMGKFSTDEHHLKSIMFPSSSKKNQKKEVSSHYEMCIRDRSRCSSIYATAAAMYSFDPLFSFFSAFSSLFSIAVPRIL